MRWFGADFARLHPALQALHRGGGTLRGEVEVSTGSGLGGLLGRRLARRLGIPLQPARQPFEVAIEHAAGAMRWRRRFGAGGELLSTFRPVGRYPDGHWRERNGPVELRLGVDLADGGWRWRLLGLRAFALPLPRWPLRTQADKRVEADGRYRFGVAFSLAAVGLLLRYEGVLRIVPDPRAGPGQGAARPDETG
ncbi:DUF4166 domain-containing protein [Luteimonas aquatica]|uniref:DUF4166 domain-containing protein n=1 Tax=Luteimonas aquatica TaxID=450364 RepID=UPI001F5A8E9F|nr:DUF4166 domain-containing protein [Luteimonas aquatica]